MELVIGTVQFGVDYGITNQKGQTPNDEVYKILEYAHSEKIKVLDTSPAYGQSETVLGGHFAHNKFEIMTKTTNITESQITSENLLKVELDFQNSLERLGVRSVEGLFVHNATDLLKKGSLQYYEMLKQFRRNKQVKKLGVSVYEQSEIEDIFSKYDFDMVQLPINVFDQRLKEHGVLAQLKEMNLEIYARSIFLQGLLLNDTPFISKKFQDKYSLFERYFRDLERNGMSKLEGALKYIADIKEIDYAIVGVNNLSQLKELIKAYRGVQLNTEKFDFTQYACSDKQIIDPRRW